MGNTDPKFLSTAKSPSCFGHAELEGSQDEPCTQNWEGRGGLASAWGRAACREFSCLTLGEPSPRADKQTSKNLCLAFPRHLQLGQTGAAFWGGKAQLQHQGRAHIKVLLCSIPILQMALNMLKARGTSKCLGHPGETLPVEF